MKPFINNNNAGAVPLILFVVTVFACGALYTLFFIEIAYPTFSGWIPAGDIKVVVMMLMYAIPLFIIIVGCFALLLAGLKREAIY